MPYEASEFPPDFDYAAALYGKRRKVTIPGALAEWLNDSSYEWPAHRRVTRGRGYSVEMDLTPEEIAELREWVEYCVDANCDDPNPSELAAARKVLAATQ